MEIYVGEYPADKVKCINFHKYKDMYAKIPIKN